MSNYTKTTDFAAKDSLATGNPSKIVRGSEFETEFDAISTAIATKADTAGPTFTGTATFATTNATTVQIGGVAITSTAAELNLLDGVTATTAELNILDGVTSTATELNLLDGITGILDEDNMASDSATALATQQSIKAYVDTTVAATNELVEDTTPQLGGNLDLNSNNITGTGNIDVTGTVTADGGLIGDAVSGSLGQTGMLTVSDTNTTNTWTNFTGTAAYLPFAHELAVVNLADATTNSFAGLYFMAGETSAATGISSARIGAVRTGASTADLAFSTRSGGNMNQAMRIAGNGDVSFYEDTGTTAKLFWDASAESLGIGTTSPASLASLHLKGAGGTELHMESGDGASTSVIKHNQSTDALEFYPDGSLALTLQSDNEAIFESNVGIGTSSPRTLLHVTGLTGDDDPALGSSTAPVFISNTANSYGLNIGVNNAGAGWLQAQSNTASTSYNLLLNPLGGNVGIGTSSPSNVLHVNSGSTDVTALFESTDAAARIQLKDNASSGSNTISVEGNEMYFFTNGARAIHIDDSQNVGIGTSSPARKLHVNSAGTQIAAVFQSSSTNSGRIALMDANTTADNYVNVAASGNALAFYTGASETVRISSGGNLLVGKTSSDLNTEGVELQSDRIYATRDGGQALAVNRKTSDGSLISFHKDGTEFGSIKVVNSNNLWVGGSVADHAGLQFGTHVIIPMEASSGSDGTLDLGNSTNRFKDLYLSGDVYATNIKGQNDTNTKIEFVGGDVTRFVQGGTERARFSATGHFLVGKTSTTLSAAGAEIRSTGLIRATTNDATVLQLNRTTGTGTAIDFRYDGTTVGAVVAEASNIRVNFTTDGNQYIKGNNTSDFLSFYTAGAEDMRLTSGGDLHVDGNVIAYSTTISDRRLKSDITNISDALDKVGQINGVTFVRDHNGEKAAGVVAQEIMEVLPEAVKSQALPLQTGEQDQEYYVVEYDAVTGLLVEAVKELKARVEALEAQ